MFANRSNSPGLYPLPVTGAEGIGFPLEGKLILVVGSG